MQELQQLSNLLDVGVFFSVKEPYREKTPSNKTSTLPKSTNMDIWVVGTSNQLFIRGS